MQLRSKLFYAYATFVVLYAATFLLPRPIATLHRFELSELQYRLLSLTVFIPVVLIWLAAIYGYSKLRAYNQLISDTPDGRHVARITTGLMILAFGLPVNAIISATGAIIVQHIPSIESPIEILTHYVALSIPLAAFLNVAYGARGLSILSKQRPSFGSVNLLAVIFIGISVAYCYIMVTSQNLGTIYHLPNWLVLVSIVCPYLFTWYLGLVAAYEVHLYSRKAPGVLYRKTWNMLALGIGAIILMQIAVQYVSTLTVQFSSLRLVRLLVIIYILLAALSVGYLLVAIGAKRLRKIEEV